jgi:hypothetical protein
LESKFKQADVQVHDAAESDFAIRLLKQEEGYLRNAFQGILTLCLRYHRTKEASFRKYVKNYDKSV